MEQIQQTTKTPPTQQLERRYNPEKAEYRAADSGAPELFGYALRFGSSYDMGWFTESVDRGALEGADLTDVRVLFNHDSNIVLGRTKAGTATVGIDDNGLWYRATLPDSPNGQNVKVALERGDVDQSSWGFYILSDTWEMRDGKDHRIIKRVGAVLDASAVTYPANPDTSAAKRSLEAAKTTTTELRPDMAETYELLSRSLHLKAAINNKQI
jgi:HK97 family phage prohead protease